MTKAHTETSFLHSGETCAKTDLPALPLEALRRIAITQAGIAAESKRLMERVLSDNLLPSRTKEQFLDEFDVLAEYSQGWAEEAFDARMREYGQFHLLRLTRHHLALIAGRVQGFLSAIWDERVCEANLKRSEVIAEMDRISGTVRHREFSLLFATDMPADSRDSRILKKSVDLDVAALRSCTRRWIAEIAAKTKTEHVSCGHMPVGEVQDTPVTEEPDHPKSWSDLEILFTSDKQCQLKFPGRTEVCNYAELGFIDNRTRNPNKAWGTLRCLAECQGTIDKKALAFETRRDTEKRVQEIRRVLRARYPLAEDPLPFVDGVGYQAQFRISCLPSYGSVD